MNSRLLIIDALGLVYRSFYAIQSLSTAAGRPTNAVYGFIKTLRQLEKVWQPTHELVVFDGGSPKERTELWPQYKAQRPPMPDALREQLPGVESFLNAARVAHVRLVDTEADDIMASVADQASAQGLEALAATADKDLMQIVGGGVFLVTPGKAEDRLGPEEVALKTGVRPDQIVEWLALIGDTADNIPGVPGVGPKTATKWLNEWGSLESLWAHLDALKPEKLRQALQQHRDAVVRNVALMRLQKDIRISHSMDDLKRQPPDERRLLQFYQSMEFHSLARDLQTPSLL